MSHHSSKLPNSPIIFWLLHEVLTLPYGAFLLPLSPTSSATAKPSVFAWQTERAHGCSPNVSNTFPPQILCTCPWVFMFYIKTATQPPSSLLSISAQMSHPQKGLRQLRSVKWKAYHFLIPPTILVIYWMNERMISYPSNSTLRSPFYPVRKWENPQRSMKIKQQLDHLSQDLKLLYRCGFNTSNVIGVL